MHSNSTDPSKTILICEDDRNLRKLIKLVLGDRYAFTEATDGHEAVELARKIRPDLVVLDLMLPGRSGFDVLAMLREEAAVDGVPVLVISAWSHADSAALEAGADRFLPKPFEADDLETAVTDLLGEP
jgi:DNA-binding response OmpR family regulator